MCLSRRPDPVLSQALQEDIVHIGIATGVFFKYIPSEIYVAASIKRILIN